MILKQKSSLLLVIPTEVEIFYYFEAKALLLVIPAKLEIFWKDLYAQKSTGFGYSYKVEIF